MNGFELDFDLEEMLEKAFSKETNNATPVTKQKKVAMERKKRRSKLATESAMVMRLWGEGKTLNVIRGRLLLLNIVCVPSTISRFIKESRSL